jgi:lycopene cyclase domain-containing protein
VPEYTVLTVLGVGAAAAVDLRVLRTRLLATSTFWISLGIMWFFQIFVDGWLTKLSSPIVRYDPDRFSGIRLFFDSPVEDFGFGFAMILLTLSTWQWLGARDQDASDGSGAGVGTTDRARVEEVVR